MIAAILALVTAIVGGIFGVVKGGRAQYLQKQEEYQSNKDFARAKDLSLYGMYSSQEQEKTIIIVAGFAGMILLVYFLMKQKK